MELQAHQAVRLFVERASAARTDFALTQENAAAVAEVVRRLDGIPLSIELAAARVNVLSPAQIASMLDDQFRLLTGGSRRALERQQTMRASIDWSFKNLSEAEQTLFRRLSVFSGGTTLEAAEQVTSDDELPAPEVLDLLSHLVQKSLLETSESHGRVRYRFLEMIRQYGREKLNDSGESEFTRNRHRDLFTNLVDEAERHWRTAWSDEIAWFDAIAADYDNVRSAVEWSIDRREKSEALTAASALYPFWWARRSFGDEAWSWLERSLALDGDVKPEILGRAYVARGYASALSGKPSEERRISGQKGAEAFEQAQMNDPSTLKALALVMEAVHTGEAYKWDLYERAVKEAHRAAEAGDAWARSAEFTIEGVAEAQRGNYAKARSLLDRGRDLEASIRSVMWQSDSDIWLIPVAMAQGDYEGARRYAEEELSMWRNLKDDLRVAHALNSLAQVSLAQKRLEDARDEIEESLSILQRLGDARDIAGVTHSLGEVEEAAGNPETARSLFSESLYLSRKTGDVETIRECLWGLSRLAAEEGKMNESLRLLAEAVRLQGDPVRLNPWVRRLAESLIDAGEDRTATLVLGALAYLAEAQGRRFPPREVENYEEALARARQNLGEENFSALWEEGASVDIGKATELVLEAADRISGQSLPL